MSQTLTKETRARRSDATLNRLRILDAAREVFRESPAASLHSIAKRAGIGQGTLYRNFPTLEALALALHHEELLSLVDCADHMLANQAPLAALRNWLGQLSSFGQKTSGLNKAFLTLTPEQLEAQGCGPVIEALGKLLDACQKARQLRSDLTAEDLLLLTGFLWQPTEGPEGEDRKLRLLGVLLDGIAPNAPLATSQ